MWALDLGTTNTLLARWDRNADRPELLELPEICRGPRRAGALETPRVVPSAVHVLDKPGFWARLGQAAPLSRHLFLGKLAQIGRAALELNGLRQRPNFVPTFKRALGQSPLLPLARTAQRAFTAREVARLFLRELFAHAKAATGERIRELVITSPVEAFESYRAELVAAGKSLGVRKMRFIDEPVAAALGYGLGLSRSRRALVVDFGGGTLHLALVQLNPAGVQTGHCEVLAKAGRDLGGNLVDRWLLEEFCRRLEYPLDDDSLEEVRLWHRLMLADACRVKESLYFEERAIFELSAPDNLLRLEARLRGGSRTVEVTRDDLLGVLRERGLYTALEGCLAEVLAQAAAAGLAESAIDDVLMVGGSTLLPGVYPLFEARFGRDRVRAWQPFEAVAYGGCVFAAGRIEPADFIVHDYALLTYDLVTKQPEHTVLIPKGTRFPTERDLWKRQLVPTCSLGEPERVFKLVICEIGSAGSGQTFGWDERGQVHDLSIASARGGGPLLVKLNEANPALGYLDPPHSPKDLRPRLEVSFGVNAERWLVATVLDLRTKKHLMRGEPVVGGN
jgi:molecular chaperone DnaK (HSP70)